MELKDIVAINGKPGLFEIKAQSKGGIIVESLLDGKRVSIGVSQNISALNEIAMYTYEEEVPLRLIFKTIAEKYESKEAISPKASNTELASFFREVLPSYDEERVYASNIKKVAQWYNLLASKNFDFSSIKADEEVEEKVEEKN